MSQKRSEDVLGYNLDHCLADSLVKIAGGAAIGTLSSVLLFKTKRTWPIWIGVGIGIGMGWSNCRHELQKPNLLYGKKVQTKGDDGKPSYEIIVQQENKH